MREPGYDPTTQHSIPCLPVPHSVPARRANYPNHPSSPVVLQNATHGYIRATVFLNLAPIPRFPLPPPAISVHLCFLLNTRIPARFPPRSCHRPEAYR